MKLFIVFLFPLCMAAQSDTTCKGKITQNYDRMTGESSRSAETVAIKSGKSTVLTCTPGSSAGIVNLSFHIIASSACINYNEEVYFLLSDSTRLMLKTFNDHNCNGRASVAIPAYAMNEFKDVNIIAIRLWASHNYTECDVSAASATMIRQGIRCLAQQ